MKDYFLNMFEYNDWANKRSMDSIKKLDETVTKPLELMCHILNAQVKWLDRIKRTNKGPESFWQSYSLDTCFDISEKSTMDWLNFIEYRTDENLFDEILYQNSKGQDFRNKLSEIITHIISHGIYHRGQIANIIRSVGGNPAQTDYIIFER